MFHVQQDTTSTENQHLRKRLLYLKTYSTLFNEYACDGLMTVMSRLFLPFMFYWYKKKNHWKKEKKKKSCDGQK